MPFRVRICFLNVNFQTQFSVFFSIFFRLHELVEINFALLIRWSAPHLSPLRFNSRRRQEFDRAAGLR